MQQIIYSIAPRIPPGRSNGYVECCVLVLGSLNQLDPSLQKGLREGPGGGLGGPWGGLGDPGAAPQPWGSYLLPRKCSRKILLHDTFFRAPLGGSLGAPWGVLGGPRGAPGRSQAPFWAPRSDPDDKGAHSGGSQGGSRRVKNLPENVFLRSREGKCVYFQRFKHVHFVDLMWPLGAPGPPLGGFGGPWGRQGRSWGRPGGRPGGNDPPLGRSREVLRGRVPPPGGARRAL